MRRVRLTASENVAEGSERPHCTVVDENHQDQGEAG